MQRALSLYQSSLQRRPLLTKMTTAAIVLSLADLNCQRIVQSTERLDFWRMKNMTLNGFLWVGPVIHIWYKFLQFGPRFITALPLPAKVVLDISVMAPLMS